MMPDFESWNYVMGNCPGATPSGLSALAENICCAFSGRGHFCTRKIAIAFEDYGNCLLT